MNAADDPLSFIDDLEPLREALRGLVASFVQDGFSEEQARELAVAIWVSSSRQEPHR